MGSGIVFSWFYGSRQREKLEQSMFQSFLFILAVTVMITGASLLFLDQLLHLFEYRIEYLSDDKSIFIYHYLWYRDLCFYIIISPPYLEVWEIRLRHWNFFGDFVGDQYRIGLYICSSASDGSIRSSLCHGHRAGSIGSRNCSLYTVEGKEVSISKRMLKGERELFCMIVNQSPF